MISEARELIDYWYSEDMSSHWFNSTEEIDRQLREKYQSLWQTARDGQLDHWMDSPQGCLALIILCDQLPLNMFRGEAHSFSTESKAITVAHYAIEQGFNKLIPRQQLAFLYMPLMHSENLEDQDLAVSSFEQAGLDENAKFARHHREIVRRFGRFPHRNAILGRNSSEEELAYLASDEAFTG